MRNNVALCAADNSDRYWRFGSGGAKLCLEADEDWLQCCRSARYACATRNSTGVVPDDLLLAISYTGVRRELNLAADEMLRVGGKVLAITGFTRMPCNSVLLIACIPLPKNKRQTALQSLLVTLREC